ncbi:MULTISPECIES: ABC transporter substrate-binding protein [unclassified Duganella]|uniref:substrate-binding periplasmic protein n=1 Tax=unclassified Duganella TaxID=2636909 RepID=UPI000E3459E2|nr:MULTISPECIES: transporter substrate-binding domain-containing protein [unclassified Duganella]RFP08045.1 ABC transporter substrate-binding protein [Duganella sp. BJB475]RFP23850.1 ABC transporter substrate-binding protein [Duganella sp. BJB476]
MPKPVPSLFALPLAALSLTAAHAAPGELVMLAPLDQTMPIVRFSNGALDGGILKDVGDALAQRLGLRAVYLSVDVAGVTPALSSGRADAMCYVMPVWIDGDYDWSTPLLPDTELVVAHADAPRLRSLKDLRDRPIGTVAGYRYPRLEQVLGRRFFRIDSASMDVNVQQMVAGKVQYTLAGENTLFYLQRIHPTLKLRPELVFASFKAQCAFSRKSQVPFTDANRVIDAMLKEGVIDQILARYR